jgi:hypothetical protein
LEVKFVDEGVGRVEDHAKTCGYIENLQFVSGVV